MPDPDPVPVPPAPLVAPGPSTLQVASAAAQNIVLALIVAYAWYLGKIAPETALGSLAAILGVDFLGRKRVGMVGATLATTWGATAVFDTLRGYTGMIAVVVALLSGGCTSAPSLAPAANFIEAMRHAYRAGCDPIQSMTQQAACYKAWVVLDGVITQYNDLNATVKE